MSSLIASVMTSSVVTNHILPVLMATDSAASDAANSKFDITTFLKNATSTLKGWGGLFIGLIGVIMVIVSIFKIASGLISHGKKQVNWVVAILLLIIGGAFIAGEWSFVYGIAAGGKKTIDELGDGTGGLIIPYISMLLH